MRLLDRYLLRELLVPLGYCLGGFLIFWITYDLFTELNNFQAHHLLARDIAAYYLVKLPELLVIVIPIGLLLALLYALTNHARHHELTAIRAAGVTVWRVAAPYFAVALAAGAVLFVLNEYAVPHGAETAQQILDRRSAAAAPQADLLWKKSVVFKSEHDQHSWIIGAYNVLTHEMQHVHIEWLEPDGATHAIDAQRGLWTNETWTFFDVQEVTHPAGTALAPPPRKSDVLSLPEFTETPRLIQSEIKISRLDSIKTARQAQLSIREILEYLQLHPQLDRRRSDLLQTMLHSRLAMPWTCVVVVLISLPFGAASGRRNVFVGVASSVFICFLFFVVRELSLALGGGGRVDPWLAAWVPNLLFGLGGIVLTQRTR